jgi:putative ABC transport system substrate-binding protein
MSADAIRATAKGMELLKQLAPGIRRIGAFHRKRKSGRKPRGRTFREADDKAAKALNIEIIGFGIAGTDDFDDLFKRVSSQGVDAISIRTGSAYTATQRKRMAEAALRAKLPSVSTSNQMVRLGGLISVGTDRTWLFRRAAAYVALILKGIKPSELPVERPSKFQVVINLKTAKALGITVPPALLLRADKVIE